MTKRIQKDMITRFLVLSLSLVLSFSTWDKLYAQDEPSTAINTTVGAAGCVAVTVDPAVATPSANPGPAGCAGNFAGQPDIWVTLTVPATGVLYLSPNGTVDAGMAIYTANGSNYTQIDCDDDSGPGLMPQITVTTLAPGTPVYIQLWAYSGGLISFNMCTYDCDPALTFYGDTDGDGFGDINNTSCSAAAGYVSNSSDCNDNNAAINPNASEDCNDPADNDCDGSTIDCDFDGDGFDATVDCNDNCDLLFPGAACDDGNPNTTGDVYTGANCVCQGSPPSACTPESGQSITFNGGANPPAAITNNVQICYTLNYTMASGDWLDGIAFTLGAGWNNIQPAQAPANCGGGAPLWIWQTSNSANSANCGLDTGPGYYFDTNGDGNGGNDWGDGGACTFVACVTADMVSTNNLTVSVLSGGDSYFGSYTSCPNNCAPTPFNYPSASSNVGCQINLPPCIIPTACDVNTGNYSIVAADGNVITFFNPPAAGQLVVSIDGTPVQFFNAPFNTSVNLNILSQLADGQSHTLSAFFTSSPTCSASQSYDSPAACGCSVTIQNVVANCTGTNAAGIGLYDVSFEAVITAPPASGTLSISNSCALGGPTFNLPDATLTDATPNILTFNNVLVTAPAGLTAPGCEITASFSANPGCIVDPATFYFPPITIVNIVSATQGVCQSTVNGSMNTIDLLMNVTNPPASAATMDILVDGTVVGNYPIPPDVASAPVVVTIPAIFVENPTNPAQFNHVITFDFAGANCMAINPTPGVPNTTSYPFTFTGPNGEVNANCVCSLNILSVTPSQCDGYVNTYSLDVEIEINNAPSTETLNFYIYNPLIAQSGLLAPVSSTLPGAPQVVTINDIILQPGVASLPETLTASFTGFTAANACQTTFNFTAPAACDCAADVGTFNISGVSVTGNNIVICNNQTLTFNSNDDFTPPAQIVGDPYQPGLGIAIYDATQNVLSGDVTQGDNLNPLAIISQDIVGNSIGNLSITNNNALYTSIAGLLGLSPSFDAPVQFQLAVVTLYNTSTNPITIPGTGSLANFMDPLSGTCGNVGTVYTVTLVPPVTLGTGVPDCQAGSYTISVEEGDAGSNVFDWTISAFSPANVTAADFPNGSDLVLTNLVNGNNISVTLTDPNGCTQIVTHGPFVGPLTGQINLPAGISANSICESTPAFQLVGNDPNGTWTIDPNNPWTGPALSGPPLDATGTFYPSVELAVSPVLYTYVIFTPTGCSTPSAPFAIAVQPTVVPTSANLPDLCVNSPMLNLGFFGGPSGGVWSGTGVQGTSNFNPSVSGPGTFTLTYDVSNAAGVTCGTINDPNIPITITVNDPVPATMTPSLTEGCEDLVIGVYNNTPNSTNCIWKINGADFFGSCDSIHTTLTDPGCYDFTLITTDPNNCVDTLDMQDLICVFPTPEVSFISSPSSVTMDDPQFTFHNTSPALVGLDWDFAGYGSSTSNDPVFSFDDVTSAGTYTVCLLGTDVNGCQNSYCNDVLIKDAFQVYTPSAITPDNDNLNEAFRPVITGEDQVKDYYMRIFDRWGNIVFETHDMKEYWNANNNGDQYYVNNGVYHWLLEITLYGLDATQYFEGSLSVVR